MADTAERATKQRSLAGNWRTVMQTCNPPKGRIDTVSRWLVLTRACVQPMTITAAAIAGLLAVHIPGADWFLFALASVGIVLAHARVCVSPGQRMVLTELKIETRAERGTALRGEQRLAERHDVQTRIQDRGIDDCVVIDLAALEIQKKRRALVDRAAEIRSASGKKH